MEGAVCVAWPAFWPTHLESPCVRCDFPDGWRRAGLVHWVRQRGKVFSPVRTHTFIISVFFSTTCDGFCGQKLASNNHWRKWDVWFQIEVSWVVTHFKSHYIDFHHLWILRSGMQSLNIEMICASCRFCLILSYFPLLYILVFMAKSVPLFSFQLVFCSRIYVGTGHEVKLLLDLVQNGQEGNHGNKGNTVKCRAELVSGGRLELFVVLWPGLWCQLLAIIMLEVKRPLLWLILWLRIVVCNIAKNL